MNAAKTSTTAEGRTAPAVAESARSGTEGCSLPCCSAPDASARCGKAGAARPPAGSYRAFKRLQDVILSATALLVLWPFLLLLAVLIVLDSPGASPVFAQTRVGRNGRCFTFYKFRSMYPHAEEELEQLLPYNEMEGPAFKIKDDPRITRVGRFIRRTGLDELPQLWNVLRGEMSIVGPRPPLPREVEQYDDYALQRLQVTPGLTCYWQVQPDRNGMTFRDWVDLDIKYIRECSFVTDWKIIFRTVCVVFAMTGR